MERKFDVVSEFEGFESISLTVFQKKIKQCEKIAVFLKSKRGNMKISNTNQLILGKSWGYGSNFLIRTLLNTL